MFSASDLKSMGVTIISLLEAGHQNGVQFLEWGDVKIEWSVASDANAQSAPSDPGSTYWTEPGDDDEADYIPPDESEGPDEPPSDDERKTEASPTIPPRIVELNAEYEAWENMSAPNSLFDDEAAR